MCVQSKRFTTKDVPRRRSEVIGAKADGLRSTISLGLQGLTPEELHARQTRHEQLQQVAQQEALRMREQQELQVQNASHDTGPLLNYLDRELTNAVLPRTRLSYHVLDMCPKNFFVQARLQQDQQRQRAEEIASQAAELAACRKEAEIAAVQQAIDARVLLPSQIYFSEPGISCSGHSSHLCA